MDNRIKNIADSIGRIAEHYGYESQSRQCMEECAELIQAINKQWRNKDFDGSESIIEEMADVLITWCQMYWFLSPDSNEIFDMVNSKLDRQISRMKED